MRLRFFFDPGSGVCFWSGDDEARARFGDYPVEIAKLGLEPALAARGEALIARHDLSLDWNGPGGTSPWAEAERAAFAADAGAFLADVRGALPSIRIDDETVSP